MMPITPAIETGDIHNSRSKNRREGLENFTRGDISVLVIFGVVLLALPFVIGYRKRRQGFLALTFAGRNLGYVIMTSVMSLDKQGFAMPTGMSGWSVQYGVGIYAHSLLEALGLVALGWIFMPVYMASGSLTSVDYAKKRFGGKRIGIAMVILMLIINLVTKVSVELHSANLMLTRLYHVPFGLVYVGLLMGAVILVSTGGLFSLVYTSIWQFLFFATGMPVVFLFTYWSFDSWEEIVVKYQRSWPKTTIIHVTNSTGYDYTKCGIPDVNSINLIRPYNDAILPWPGMLFGLFIIAIYTTCIDQSILQFCLCGKNIVNVKYACICSSYFELLTIFMIVPGFVARIFFPDTVACSDPDVCESLCGQRSGCDDLALPLIFQRSIPPGWRGLVLAAFLAASLTSIAATLHAGATVFTFNLYRVLRPRSREIELTVAAKLAIMIQGVMGLFLVLLIEKIPLIHVFTRRVYSCLVPPLVAVYVVAIFWSHVTEEIAFSTLVLGSCFSFIRLIWELTYGTIPCGDEKKFPVPDILKNFHDLHFAVFLFIICSCYIVVNGMTTDPIAQLHLHRLIFWLRHSHVDRVDIDEMKSRLRSFSSADLGAEEYTEGEEEEAEEEEDEEEGGLYGYRGSKARDTKHQLSGEFGKEVAVADRRGCWKKFGALSNREITDDLLREATLEKTSIRELPRQSSTLNMLLILLLLVMMFVTAFFT